MFLLEIKENTEPTQTHPPPSFNNSQVFLFLFLSFKNWYIFILSPNTSTMCSLFAEGGVSPEDGNTVSVYRVRYGWRLRALPQPTS